MAVPEDILNLFKARKDNQIMGLELLSISLGLSSVERFLRKKRFVTHSDNTGSEAATRKGTARSWDHAQLVHAQWLHAAIMGIDMHVVRVPTDDNIADLPSRKVRVLWLCSFQFPTHVHMLYQDLNIFESAGATFMPPRLDAMYEKPGAWEVLQERWAAR